MIPDLQGTWKLETNYHLAPADRLKKNRRLSPSDILWASMQRIWWQCAKFGDHVWQATVNRRTDGHGCPYCSNQRVSQENNLTVRYPAVANQWHPTRNAPISPNEVIAGSRKLYWWRCFRSAKHVWQAPVQLVVRSWRSGTNGCPFCKGNKVTNESCLKAKFPEVAKLWHSSRNAPLTTDDIPPHSAKLAWWQCPVVADHIWQAPIDRVVTRNRKGNSGCPFCSGKKVSNESSLASKYPEVARLWHPTLNRALRPAKVMGGSNKLVWWQCTKSRSHVWQKKINHEVASWKRGKSGCPECYGKFN